MDSCLHLNTRVAGGHGLDIERSSNDVSIRPEALLSRPRSITLAGVGSYAELVLSVVVQVGEDRLLVGGLPQLLLVGVGPLPELDLVLRDLPVPRVLGRCIVHDLDHVWSLEPPSDVLWGIRWDAFRSEVELYCLLQQTD